MQVSVNGINQLVVKVRDDVTGTGSLLPPHPQTPLDESQQWLVVNHAKMTPSIVTVWEFPC